MDLRGALQPQRAQQLAAWLARQAGGLRRLMLSLDLQCLLPGLAAAAAAGHRALDSLVALQLVGSNRCAQLAVERRQLGSLQSLEMANCELPCITAELQALSALLRLYLVSLSSPDGSDAAWWAALGQPSSLVGLRLERCKQLMLAELARLPGLRTPEVFGGPTWHEREEVGGLEVLAQLAALTQLTLREFGLRRLLPGLAAMEHLAVLDASASGSLGAGSSEGMKPLQHLTSLTWLNLRGTGISRLPVALSALGAQPGLEASANGS